MLRLLIALGALTSSALISMAAAGWVPAGVPLPPPEWTGLYLGAHVGGAWTSADGNWTPLPSPAAFGANAISGNLNGTNVIGGVQLGYNWQFAPTWVAGIEADFSATQPKGTFSAPWTVFGTAATFPNSSTTMTLEVNNWLASLRGRIGYVVVPQALVYFTGGVAWGAIKYSAQASFNSVYNAQTSFSDNVVPGYVLGGGLEWWLFASNWTVRAEYLFYHLNSSQSRTVFDSTGHFPTILPSGFNWNNLDVNVVRAVLNFRFSPN
jgi:outer membrane immunogenic protein